MWPCRRGRRRRLVAAALGVVCSGGMNASCKFAVVSLLLVACKHAPPNAGPSAGAAATTGGPGTGPAPAPLLGHNLVYNGDFSRGQRSLPWNGELSKPAQGRT